MLIRNIKLFNLIGSVSNNEMKKKFKIEGLDCGNCANKLEEAIKKVDGVEKANLSFIMEKLTLTADEKDMNRIIDETRSLIDKMEPGVSLTEI